MVLYLSAVDQTGESRDFSCQLEQLEVAFDVLNHIVSNGDTLLSARITDENGSTALPLEAFDGAPLVDVLRELEDEWNSVLKEPELQFSFNEQEMINWVSQLIASYETRINSIELTISRLELLLERAQKSRSIDSTYPEIIQHYQSLISSYDRMLVKNRFMHRLALDRMYRL